MSFSLKIAPWTHLIHCCLVLPDSTPKWHLDQFSHFCRAADHRQFNCIHQVVPMCTSISHTCFLGPTWVHNPNSTLIGSDIFAQITAECRRACPGMSFPLKIAHSHGAIWTHHLIHGSLGPHTSSTQMASRSVELFCRAHYCDRLGWLVGWSLMSLSAQIWLYQRRKVRGGEISSYPATEG